MIRSGCRAPVESSEKLTTTSLFAVKEEIQIFQGDSKLARNNLKLGSFKYVFPEPKPRPEICLGFSLERDLLLRVSIYDTASPSAVQSSSLQTKPDAESSKSRLTAGEWEEVHFIEAKEHAEDTVQSVKMAFLLANVSWDKILLIQNTINELESALKTKDFAAASTINDHTAALKCATMNYFERTHHRRYHPPHHHFVHGQLISDRMDLQSPLF
jgi:molecular chaperone DnaK (HSP70)